MRILSTILWRVINISRVDLILCFDFVVTMTFQSLHSPTIIRCTTGLKTPIILRSHYHFKSCSQYWNYYLCCFSWNNNISVNLFFNNLLSIIFRRVIIIPRLVQAIELILFFCFYCYDYISVNPFSNHLQVYMIEMKKKH